MFFGDRQNHRSRTSGRKGPRLKATSLSDSVAGLPVNGRPAGLTLVDWLVYSEVCGLLCSPVFAGSEP